MSPEHPANDPELNDLESSLGTLVPARSRIDRDRVMFRAGRASVRPPVFGRRARTAIEACLVLVALTEFALLVRRPAPPVVERVVVVHEPAPPAVIPAPVPAPEAIAVRDRNSSEPRPETEAERLGLGRTPYEQLTLRVLRYGLDGLPPPSAGRGGLKPEPILARSLSPEELQRILDPGDPS